MHERMGEFEPYGDEWLVDLYFRHGSVENAIRSFDNLPVSVASFHRAIKRYGVIKQAGRRRLSLAKTLYFFAQKALDPAVPLETLYRSMPPSFKQSASIGSLHRIYSGAMGRVERLHATGLIITPQGDGSRILTVEEKTGERTIPFGHSIKTEPAENSVLRVLQHEFSTKMTLERKLVKGSSLTRSLIPKNRDPLFRFHILDIGVDIYHLEMPPEVVPVSFSSYKVSGHKFEDVEEVIAGSEGNTRYRVGTPELLGHYHDMVLGTAVETRRVSSLNKALLGQF